MALPASCPSPTSAIPIPAIPLVVRVSQPRPDTGGVSPADTGTKLNLSLLGLKSIWNPASLQSLGGEALDRENLTGPPSGSF